MARKTYTVSMPGPSFTGFARVLVAPTVRETGNGTKVTDILVAASNSWPQRQDGNIVKDENGKTVYASKDAILSLVAWRGLAERIGMLNIKAGDILSFEFRLSDVDSQAWVPTNGGREERKGKDQEGTASKVTINIGNFDILARQVGEVEAAEYDTGPAPSAEPLIEF